MERREVMSIFYAVNAVMKIQHIKPSTVKVYRYLKKLHKNLEEAHFKSTLESFVKCGYFVMQGEANEESIFSVKALGDILEHYKQFTPQYNTRTEITELEQFLIPQKNAAIMKRIYHKLLTTLLS